MIYKLLCLPLILALMLGTFFALRSATYALEDSPAALIAFIVLAAIVTAIMARVAFRMTVRKSQVERIAREYGVSMTEAESMLDDLRKGATP